MSPSCYGSMPASKAVWMGFNSLGIRQKTMINIKDLVKNNNTVHFQYLRDGDMWYKTDKFGFIFPVPLDDIGNATFMRDDKAILFMRYIRKHMEDMKEFAKASKAGVTTFRCYGEI